MTPEELTMGLARVLYCGMHTSITPEEWAALPEANRDAAASQLIQTRRAAKDAQWLGLDAKGRHEYLKMASDAYSYVHANRKDVGEYFNQVDDLAESLAKRRAQGQ